MRRAPRLVARTNQLANLASAHVVILVNGAVVGSTLPDNVTADLAGDAPGQPAVPLTDVASEPILQDLLGHHAV